MPNSKDPTLEIRQAAAAFPDVATGTACNQSSFKAGKGTFLFIGPGAKGVGYKAMFKLSQSLDQARKLADKTDSQPQYQVGSSGWVTVRFSTEHPFPKMVWKKWLKESYQITIESSKTNSKPIKKKAKKKK